LDSRKKQNANSPRNRRGNFARWDAQRCANTHTERAVHGHFGDKAMPDGSLGARNAGKTTVPYSSVRLASKVPVKTRAREVASPSLWQENVETPFMSSVAVALLGRIEDGMASNVVEEELGEDAPRSDPLGELVMRCRRREQRAQSELVARTQDRVYHMLVRLVGAQDAEDVAQQVYLQLFRKIHQFGGDSSFGTWLYRVTINEAMQHLRRNRRRRFAILSWEPEDHKADRNHQSEARELLDRALTRLEPELRSVFVLREVEQLSYEEIGGALGIPMGTVASRLSRARHDLQERLRSLGWDG
jgi:RNA polymerase sigma-70 factor (ECF subfamily)